VAVVVVVVVTVVAAVVVVATTVSVLTPGLENDCPATETKSRQHFNRMRSELPV